MIYITDKAVERVLQIQKDESLEQNFFVRVSVVGGGCSGLSYKLDFDNQPQQGDQVFVDKGITMVTDIKSFLYLCDTTLDYSDGLDGKGFHFVNPNAARTCACGESFSV
ncbi:MAG: iron-sulfur cluster assembly accessory protein [Sphingobacteriales bacterium]|nr:MAG: iron-sulfur cluster assembly accessory protein [Sphingobacteriales bacterium]